MAGIFGLIGESISSERAVADAISYDSTEASEVYDDGSVAVAYSDHAHVFAEQPVTASDGTLHWCWGDILGHEHDGTYTPRDDSLSDPAYCASLYDQFGLDFVSGLNSDFVGVILDPTSEQLYLYTDRLSSRPLYYLKTCNGGLLFTTHIHALTAHPSVSLRYDPQHLLEFFHTTRVFGTNTPVDGVNQCPPGSVLTFTYDGEYVDTRRYWWPVLDPVDKPYSWVVDEFRSVFREAVNDRIPADGEAGLLLSGGSDSRLLLAEAEFPMIGFHMNERLLGNREAEIARQVAEVGGAEFQFLQRDLDYYPTVLEESVPITNYNGVFRHSHALGFKDEIRSSVDVLFSGHYADTYLKGHYTPRRFRSTLIRRLLPSLPPLIIRDEGTFIEALKQTGFFTERLLFTLDQSQWSPSLSIERTPLLGDIQYLNVSNFSELAMICPLTNGWGINFYESNCQILPTRYPFLDNRVIDIALTIPRSVRLNEDIVSSALSRYHPNLARIVHPSDFVSVNRSPTVRHYSRMSIKGPSTIKEKLLKTLGVETAPTDWSGPWADHEELIRQHDFIENTIEANLSQLAASKIISEDEVWSTYKAHLNGANHTNLLYALAMTLKSPVEIP